MKRAAALIPLSRQHHEALVLARRACEPDRAGAEPRALRALVLERAVAHFEPHFALEEQVLLPALVAAGAAGDADEVLRQHSELRGLMERLREGDAEALALWGEAMQRHVRWEERALFPRVERLLDLRALEDAFHKRGLH